MTTFLAFSFLSAHFSLQLFQFCIVIFLDYNNKESFVDDYATFCIPFACFGEKRLISFVPTYTSFFSPRLHFIPSIFHSTKLKRHMKDEEYFQLFSFICIMGSSLYTFLLSRRRGFLSKSEISSCIPIKHTQILWNEFYLFRSFNREIIIHLVVR